jgi:erythritol kinase (D-erythritol 1-phosphate-forming)
MSGPLIVALDSGTSVVKALAFDVAGKVVTEVSHPNVISSGPGSAVEQDMVRTWQDACAVLNELAVRLDGAEVAALALTGQGDGTWLVDRADTPVAAAILWLDARAAKLVEALRNSGAARAAFAFTGTGLAACQQPAQLLWLDRNCPDVLERATTAFHCKDWLYLKLTGGRATDPSEASFSFGDYRTRNYREEVLDSLGPAHLRRLLPPLWTVRGNGTGCLLPLPRGLGSPKDCRSYSAIWTWFAPRLVPGRMAKGSRRAFPSSAPRVCICAWSRSPRMWFPARR